MYINSIEPYPLQASNISLAAARVSARPTGYNGLSLPEWETKHIKRKFLELKRLEEGTDELTTSLFFKAPQVYTYI
jgi:hypothetical protein